MTTHHSVSEDIHPSEDYYLCRSNVLLIQGTEKGEGEPSSNAKSTHLTVETTDILAPQSTPG